MVADRRAWAKRDKKAQAAEVRNEREEEERAFENARRNVSAMFELIDREKSGTTDGDELDRLRVRRALWELVEDTLTRAQGERELKNAAYEKCDKWNASMRSLDAEVTRLRKILDAAGIKY